MGPLVIGSAAWLAKIAKLLPLISAGAGALPGLKEGDLLKEGLGGLGGYGIGRFGRGKIPWAAAAPGSALASGTLLNPVTSGAYRSMGAAVPWLIGAPLASNVLGGMGGGQQQARGGSPTGTLPYNQPGYGVGDYINPLSSLNLGLGYTRKQGAVNVANAQDMALMMQPIIEEAKAREFQRGMAAARYRTKLGTEAGLTMGAQRGAQNLANIGMQGIAQGLTANYQYS